MLKYLFSFIIFTNLCLNNALAMESEEIYGEDIELSKRNFIISKVSREDIENKRRQDVVNNLNIDQYGVMTLCYKPNQDDHDYDHAALVFEFYKRDQPNDIYACMIHYRGIADCGGMGCITRKMNVAIEDPAETLKRVHRKKSRHVLTHIETPKEVEFIKYASWIIDNNKLRNAYDVAFRHKGQTKGMYNCVSYVQRIMEEVRFERTSFGWWLKKMENLKILVNDYIQPKFDKREYN